MAAKKGLTEAQVAKAILAANGLLTYAAARLGVTQPAVSHWVARSDACRVAQEQALERRKDIAEHQLHELIEGKKNGANLGAICFFLKCRAKDRGYIERVDSHQVEERQVTVTHKLDLETLSNDEQRQYREILAALVDRSREGTGADRPRVPPQALP